MCTHTQICLLKRQFSFAKPGKHQNIETQTFPKLAVRKQEALYVVYPRQQVLRKDIVKRP